MIVFDLLFEKQMLMTVKSYRRIALLAVFLTTLVLVSGVARARESTDLSGQWRFRLDPNDKGEAEKWFTQTLDGKIHLPGSLQTQGFGNDPSVDTQWIGSIKDQRWFKSPEYEKFRQPGHVKIPCWLQPEKHYVGAAWYQRDIDLSSEWKDQRVELFLERCHWFTDVWIDDQPIGSGESLCVPHEFTLPSNIAPGNHTLTIRVDNRIRYNIGHDSHSISDHTQTNWNGIIGELRLTARPRVWIDSVKTYPGKTPGSVRVVAEIGNDTGKLTGRLQAGVVEASGGGKFPIQTQKINIQPGVTRCEFEYSLGANPKLWNEFHPNLYRLDLTLDANIEGKNVSDNTSVSFGVRTVSSDGRRVTINGRPVFLRGTLECCIFPDTGYPPTDEAAWKRIMNVCREHGLNHLRFHSWCPPEVAFQVADEMGFYLQVELPTWAYNMGKLKTRDDFLIRELDRVLDVHGNHPSFILMTMGNELRGNVDYLTGLVEQAKRTDSRRIYACTTHHDRSPSDQFRVTMRIGKKRIKIRGLRGPRTDWDFADAIVDEKIPVLAHEIGQFCVWPDLDEIDQYTGFLKAKNFELFRQQLDERGMLPQARDFLMASGKLQAICYKEEIESMMRTPGFGGFQLLGLQDFPGQGTSLVGVLNAFWKEKGYITPEEYRRFCGETVPLARFAKRVWTSNETLTARIDLSHFGEHDLKQCAAEWMLTDDKGKVISKGALPAIDVPADDLKTLGQIRVKLNDIHAPASVKLSVSIAGTEASNDWSLWVYPDTQNEAPDKNVHIASELDDKTVATLAQGGRVLLLPPLDRIKGRPEHWQPIFWNTQWISRTGNRSLGLLCDVKHPALAAFPTDFHSDWQWHDLMNRSVAVDLTKTPANLRPIVQVIPDWNDPRREALLFECKVGEGRLLMCTADLSTDIHNRPAARQLRKSLLDYTAGKSFNPATSMTLDQLRRLFVKKEDSPGTTR
jgi:hypothetical protein